MFLPADSAKRAALLCAAALLAVLLLILLVFRPAEGLPGIGLARLLLEEKQWRAELWLEGSHINELEPWLIQETLAGRMGISTGGYKGLTRRAVNAKDPAYRAEGHLLAGNTALAAELAGSLASGQSPAAERARWRHRRADALWRGTLEDPAPELRAALAELPAGEKAARRELLADLASWHWFKANFRPEDPAGEFDQALAALTELEQNASPEPRPAWVAALHRLRGRCLLRRACLAEKRDPAALAAAAEAFERALAAAEDPGLRPEVRTAILHDLGLSQLERDEFELAARAFREVVEASSGGKAGAVTQFEVLALERRVTTRVNAQAFLALALVRQAESVETAPRQALLDEAAGLVAAVHGMTLPDEDGPAWITAQAALIGCRHLANDEAGAGVARQLALQHYPHTQAGEPGVPSLAEIEVLP